MNASEKEKVLMLCCEIGKRIVDEAVFVYKQNRKISPNFFVCRFSMQRAIVQLKVHIEQGEDLKFICISFCDMTKFTNIYINVEYIKTKMNF